MEVGLSPGDFGTQPLSKRGAEPYVPFFCSFLLWPNGWMVQDATWYGDRPQPRGLCLRWGPSPLPKRGAEPPNFGHIYCGQTPAWIKMPLGMEVGLGPDDIVLDGDPAPPKRGHSPPPQSSVHVCCGQTAGWIKMAVGMEVRLCPGQIVLDADQAPLPKRGREAPP